MSAIRTILLAEDSLADAEMAIDALREAHLANPIVHVMDGTEAMDYLHRRGKFADRPPTEAPCNPERRRRERDVIERCGEDPHCEAF